MLPPIYLSHVVSPERAIVMRNPHEKAFQFKWQSLATALDPLDFSGETSGNGPLSLSNFG
jgi:hypothetical protein